jgi:hypothetical protein
MILCDLDMVLATSNGGDTRAGQPIHRTFKDCPVELDLIKEEGIPFHVVTAKVEEEALRVIRAIGLDKYVTSVIGANGLLWPTIWLALKKRRIPSSISKAFWRKAIRGAESGKKAQCVVMIEDRRSNLLEMLEHGSIDVGILVPPIRLAGDSVVEWFDLGLALSLARVLVLRLDGSQLFASCPLRVYQLRGEQLHPTDSVNLLAGPEPRRYLIELPAMSSNSCQEQRLLLRSLETGCDLVASRTDITSLLRVCKRICRSVLSNPRR